jgi:Ca2+-binding RTX toxin-like protein
MADTNTPPTTVTTLEPLREDAVRIISAADLASDAETLSKDLEIVSLAIDSGKGDLVPNSDGTWTFTPATDDDTEVKFTFEVSDGDHFATGTATLDLLPVTDVVLSDKGGGARYTGTDDAEDILGGRGNDRVKASGGEDQVWGNDGNDRLYGGDDNDLVDGGKGNDRVYGDEGDDQVLGGIGNDHLYGGKDDDQVDGGKGNDHVYGDAGNDLVSGGIGNDHINGGEGDDELSGEAGHDRFVFKGMFGNDTISDFDVNKDTLHIDGTTYSKGNFDQLVVIEVDATTVLFKYDEANSITLENVDPNDFSLV